MRVEFFEIKPRAAFVLARRLSRTLKGAVDEQVALGMLTWTWHAAVRWAEPGDSIDILDWNDVGDIIRRHVSLHPELDAHALLAALVKARVLRMLPPSERGWRLLRFGELWRVPQQQEESSGVGS